MFMVNDTGQTDQEGPEGRQPPSDLVLLSDAPDQFPGVDLSTLRYWVYSKTLRSWKRGLGRGRLYISRGELQQLLARRDEWRPREQG